MMGEPARPQGLLRRRVELKPTCDMWEKKNPCAGIQREKKGKGCLLHSASTSWLRGGPIPSDQGRKKRTRQLLFAAADAKGGAVHREGRGDRGIQLDLEERANSDTDYYKSIDRAIGRSGRGGGTPTLSPLLTAPRQGIPERRTGLRRRLC